MNSHPKDDNIDKKVLEYLNDSRSVLVTLPAAYSVDSYYSAVAIVLIMRKMGKTADLFVTGDTSKIDFLQLGLTAKSELPPQDVLMISLDTKKAKLDELSYLEDAGKVKIFLKPKDGLFSPSDINVEVAGSAYDLIVTVGAASLESLGDVYQKNADLFFGLPKINVDIDPKNEYYGTLNIVQVVYGSIAELSYNLLIAIEPALFDEQIATALLAGIIYKTQSFQSVNTTPSSLRVASQLMNKGAKQQEVIKALFKTKPFSLLKLWGRALARIQELPNIRSAYTLLTRLDFEKTSTDESHAQLVLKEILDSASGYEMVVLMSELTSGTKVSVAALPHATFSALQKMLEPVDFSQVASIGNYKIFEADFMNIPHSALEKRIREFAGFAEQKP